MTRPSSPDEPLTASPSALAMEAFVARSPGLREARVLTPDPDLPSLPDLKKLARDRRDAGHQVLDQSAGDIADVGQPLAAEFRHWVDEARDRLLVDGWDAFARTDGDAYGFPGHYQQQYPHVLATLARSWGMSGPFQGVQTLSGRTVLDFAFRGLLARAAGRGRRGEPAILLDPLAWSGYGPLAADLGITLVSLPALPSSGLASSAEGLRAALALCADQGLDPIGMVPILPSNPTGVGLSADALRALVEVAASTDLPVLIDAFYSPLHPDGHQAAVPLRALDPLPAEVRGLVGLIVGETKVTSSQNKTGSLLWHAPVERPDVAATVVGVAVDRLKTTNAYPRPQEALVAYALHTFPGGIHAAMGPRYAALHAAREAMAQTCDAVGLPLSIGGSFYGTVALVDSDGQALVRDGAGRRLTAPRAVSQTLIERFGVVGAPGAMFSSAPEAGLLVRLTAAVTLDDVAALEGVFRQMLDEAGS